MGVPSCPFIMDEKSSYADRMPLRADMTAALRARRLDTERSLAQVAQKTGMARSAVHAIETGVTGAYLDHLEALAAALDARWELALVPLRDVAPRLELLREIAVLPIGAITGLLRVARAWSQLASDDRELVAHLAERQAAKEPARGEVVPLPSVNEARRAQ